MAKWTRENYIGNTVELARTLVGQYLVRRCNGETLICRITETEAFLTISAETMDLSVSLEEMLRRLRAFPGVIKAEVLAG